MCIFQATYYSKITDTPPKRTLDYEVYIKLLELKKLKEKHAEALQMHKPVLEMEINKCEKNIAITQGERLKKIIHEDMSHLLVDGAFSFNDAWKLKKRIFPQSADAPFAMLDKNDNLVADYKGILDIMKDEFTFRLRNRKIKDEYTELQELKEYLCQLRLQLTSKSDYSKWTMKQLNTAITKLKNNKCKDPHGHINEMYKNMGDDGLDSLLDMLNMIKEKLVMPGKLDLSNVSTLYKGKGSKQDVINLRGIFKLPIVRNLLDRLVYFDEKDQISESMGYFQVGNQKDRNIRDHTLIVHAVVNEAHAKKLPIDIQFTDITVNSALTQYGWMKRPMTCTIVE
jgi:hypothetical protein